MSHELSVRRSGVIPFRVRPGANTTGSDASSPAPQDGMGSGSHAIQTAQPQITANSPSTSLSATNTTPTRSPALTSNFCEVFQNSNATPPSISDDFDPFMESEQQLDKYLPTDNQAPEESALIFNVYDSRLGSSIISTWMRLSSSRNLGFQNQMSGLYLCTRTDATRKKTSPPAMTDATREKTRRGPLSMTDVRQEMNQAYIDVNGQQNTQPQPNQAASNNDQENTSPQPSRAAINKDLRELATLYNIPNIFWVGRGEGVTQGFGSQTFPDYHCSWFHMICPRFGETPSTEETAAHSGAADAALPGATPPNANQTNANSSGASQTTTGANLSIFDPYFIGNLIGSVFLRWQRKSGSGSSRIDLLCFLAHVDVDKNRIEKRMLKAIQNRNISKCLDDAYALYVPILQELFVMIEDYAEELKISIKAHEKACEIIFNEADKCINGNILDLYSTVDFVTLHHVARHIIRLKEGVDGMLLTIESLLKHNALLDVANPPTASAVTSTAGSSNPSGSTTTNQVDIRREFIAQTQRSLEHIERLFQSTNQQLLSLKGRSENMINLAFSFNAQRDAGCDKDCSKSAEFRVVLGLDDSFDAGGAGKCVGWETDDIGEVEGFAGAGVLERVAPARVVGSCDCGFEAVGGMGDGAVMGGVQGCGVGGGV
ncbi:hypothetical protein K440DRAFT_641685 [Wilcoxina mikolae CBS 423.85]|nr:hypothetical protein K440DRAFT_641685 [Wilcoxina mikolae CBS 423.85]